MLIVVLPNKKAISKNIFSNTSLSRFGHVFKLSRQPQRIRKSRSHQNYLLVQEYLSKLKLDNPLFCLKPA